MRDADVIAVVNKGKIVEQGPHEEVGWPGGRAGGRAAGPSLL